MKTSPGPGLVMIGQVKTLSLTECVELKFKGSIYKEALAIGDVDNDGLSELVLGTNEGDLYVYKGDKCVGRGRDLGSISAVAIGDLLNIKRNITVVITTEGFCHIFDLQEELKGPAIDPHPNPKGHSHPHTKGPGLSTVPVPTNEVKFVQQFHSQRIVANTKAIFLQDVDNDGCTELVCGLTDRVLRTYKWSPEPADDLPLNQPFTVMDGRVVGVNKWELTNQIGSLAPHVQGGLVSILVGTGGGTVTRITETTPASRHLLSPELLPPIVGSVGCRLERNVSVEKEFSPELSGRESPYSENISIRRYALNSSRMRNPNISTHVAGNVTSHDGINQDSYAVGTWDGTIMICRDDNILWTCQLNKPVMTVQSFAGNAIFVDMEGPTYLVNRRMSPDVLDCVTRFYFEDQVAGFRVGNYAMKRQDIFDPKGLTVNQKCFVYVTFHGSIFIYPIALL